jgi:hypothetical protein
LNTGLTALEKTYPAVRWRSYAQNLEEDVENENTVEKMIRLPQKAWDVIEKEALKHGRTFEEEVQWLLTADFISDEKLSAQSSLG